MDPERFFELSRTLLEDEDYQDEAGYRTVVGRAYYSAFHAVKNRLQELGSSFQEPRRIHRDVITEASRKNRMIGNKLDQLFEDRKEADYDLWANVSHERANASARLAELIHNQTPHLSQ